MSSKASTKLYKSLLQIFSFINKKEFHFDIAHLYFSEGFQITLNVDQFKILGLFKIELEKIIHESISIKEINTIIKQCYQSSDPKKELDQIIRGKSKKHMYSVAIPLYKIRFAENIEDIELNNCQIMKKGKFLKKRKQFYIPQNLSCMKRKKEKYFLILDFIENSDVICCVKVKGKNEDEAIRSAYKDLNESMNYLITSQLQELKRYQMGFPTFIKAKTTNWSEYLIFKEDNTGSIKSSRNLNDLVVKPLIKKKVRQSSNQHFFNQYLRIRNKISQNDQDRIYRTILYLGKSLKSYSIEDAFQYSFIALDILLCGKEPSKFSILADTLEALFTPYIKHNATRIKNKIHGIVQKRNFLFHDGNYTEITSSDIFFLDTIVFNALNWITYLYRDLVSLQQIKKYTENYQAYKKAGKSMPIKKSFRKVVFRQWVESSTDREKYLDHYIDRWY